ncbi:Uncharacterised protein [uncultured archaeon]|nr:Uncharacterised protein [uncultured archaeon]
MSSFGNRNSADVSMMKKAQMAKPAVYIKDSDLHIISNMKKSLRGIETGLRNPFKRSEFISSLRKSFSELTPEQKITVGLAIGLVAFTLTAGCTSTENYAAGSYTDATSNQHFEDIGHKMAMNYPNPTYSMTMDDAAVSLAVKESIFTPKVAEIIGQACDSDNDFGRKSDICHAYYAGGGLISKDANITSDPDPSAVAEGMAKSFPSAEGHFFLMYGQRISIFTPRVTAIIGQACDSDKDFGRTSEICQVYYANDGD